MTPSLVSSAWLIARKDLAIEFRTRSAFFSTLVFALMSIVIFYFTWDPTTVPASDLAPGVLWVIFTFSGILGLHRSFGLEQVERAIDGLIALPVPREAIFLGKAFANLLFVLAVQVVAIPAVALLYGLGFDARLLVVGAIAILAAVGLVSVGTLFAAMAVNTRLAELLLPVLSLPFFVPVVMPAAQATAHVLAGRPLAEAWIWLRILVAFDLVFGMLCVVAYPFTLED